MVVSVTEHSPSDRKIITGDLESQKCQNKVSPSYCLQILQTSLCSNIASSQLDLFGEPQENSYYHQPGSEVRKLIADPENL